MIKNIVFIEKCDSTNIEVKKYPLGTMLISDVQNMGKGRSGKKFLSNTSDGIWTSIKMKINISLDKISLLTQVISIAVRETLREYVDNNILKIKWPNDIYINEKKVCGILCESVISDMQLEYIIVGIGINLNHSIFDSDLLNIATSIFLETGKKINKDEILHILIKNLNSEINKFLQTEEVDVDYLNKNSYLNKKKIEFVINDKKEIGEVCGIEKNGKITIIVRNQKNSYDNINTIKVLKG